MEKKIVNKNVFGYVTVAGQEVLTPLGVVVDKALFGIEQVLKAVDNRLMNNRIVVSAAASLVQNVSISILAMQEVTRHTVRLYSLEGKALSVKHGARTRMTWYTNPVTAVNIGEHMGGLTGKLVYIDLELDYCSDYSHRFYQRGDEAYILKGELINIAKRKKKYVRYSGVTEVSAVKEVKHE